jgi:hypothetical protein
VNLDGDEVRGHLRGEHLQLAEVVEVARLRTGRDVGGGRGGIGGLDRDLAGGDQRRAGDQEPEEPPTRGAGR